MIIHQFHILSFAISKTEAKPPAIVHADAVLPFPIAAQGFEAVGRQQHQILDGVGRCEDLQPPGGLTFNAGKTANALSGEEVPRFFVGETFDHTAP